MAEAAQGCKVHLSGVKAWNFEMVLLLGPDLCNVDIILYDREIRVL